MMQITVVGLGPGNPALLTAETRQVLASASRIILRTGVHPGLQALLADPRVTTCDDLYQTLPTFDEVYAAVVARVLAAAQESDVVFGVPGHPLIGESCVSRLLAEAPAAGCAVSVLNAVSALDVAAATLGIDFLAEQAQIVDAASLESVVQAEPFSGGQIGIVPTHPVLLTQVYSETVASSAKLALSRIYPDDHPVSVITAAGVPNEQRITLCRLYELDRQRVNHLTSVWLPALAPLDAFRSFATLQHIVALLRTPEGCPWDRKQTHASLVSAILEEAYEVADAIERDDMAGLAEELGDVLLVVCMQAQIAEEAGEFILEDSIEHVTRKLIRRHPHVFGDVVAEDAATVLKNWQAIKAQERGTSTDAQPPKPVHPLDRLPRAMPAWMRAQNVLEDQRSAPAPVNTDQADRIGDALLSAVEGAIGAGLDPGRALEDALRRRDTLVSENGNQKAEVRS